MFHYLESFSLSHDDQYLDDFCHPHKFNAGLISGISDYDLGGEGDLFKAPEPIIEQHPVTIDHMTSVISTILCGEDIILQESKFTDVESCEDKDLLSNLFSEYKDTLAKETSSPPEALNFKLPVTKDHSIFVKESVHPPGTITKSVSSDSLCSVDGAQFRPSSMNSAERESKSVHGMRRVFSEGYIKPQLINDHTTETRMQKLSRYRDKKTKRNFSRKIKEGVGGWSETDQRKVCQDGRNRHLKKVTKCLQSSRN